MTEIKAKTLVLRSKHSSAESFIDAANAESENIEITKEKEPVVAEIDKKVKTISEKPVVVTKKGNKTIKKELGSRERQISFFIPIETYLHWEEYKLKMLRQGKKITLKEIVNQYLENLTRV